jgi:hypothetical protein
MNQHDVRTDWAGWQQSITRRYFLRNSAVGVGMMAARSLLAQESPGGVGSVGPIVPGEAGVLPSLHHLPTAKRVIYLCMSGAPSQLDMYDYKPKMAEMFDKDLPESIRNGQRLTTMTSKQARFPIAPSIYKFAQHGPSGAWISELLPQTAKVAGDLCIVKTVHTEAINHDPAITFLVTGSQIPGRPSMGAWSSYGLGSENRDLPTFVVMHPSWTGRKEDQALYARLWGAGFLPSRYQGVALRSKGDPVLYLPNPPGVDRTTRRAMIDRLGELNRHQQEAVGDPEIVTRIAQYEMAFRMQASVPELTDLSQEPQHVLDLYGPEVSTPGTFSYCSLMARRMAERGVRFIQLFHRGWDQHGNLTVDLPNQCRDIDHACAGLIRDLKQRGMLEETLVVWGGEFGRTIYCQGGLTRENYGRDHHPRCYTMWMAGGGIKPGIVYGETDDFSYNIVDKPVHLHDINATILHCLGIDHTRLTYRFQGRDFRLTDVHGNIMRELLV